MFKKAIEFLVKHTDKLVFATVILAAGAASAWGAYQDEAPEALSRMIESQK